MTGNEVRSSFLSYFERAGHKIERSSSLVPPASDKTLLFTNAGMVQFKDIFLGRLDRPYARATTSQKCLRVSGKHNDLEMVGKTARHQTFFEMLGNFSFGDYFKEEAIFFAWDFLTRQIGFDKALLHPTVFKDDDRAAELWVKVAGVSPERVIRMGEKDNFWAMGPVGPCGPCSEVLYDRGESFRCDRSDCAPGCECDRYLEIWNLVFMEFDRKEDGSMARLPAESIDTGMGLERLVSIIQNAPTNFATDLIRPIITKMETLCELSYGESSEGDVAFNVIGDHIRAAAFLIADGVSPSAEGRGYVLRRLIRRAVRYGRSLGASAPFSPILAPVVIETLGVAYPELIDAAETMEKTFKVEEDSFADALEHGMALLEPLIEKALKTGGRIGGDDLFWLYDRYGFPVDMVLEIAEERGVSADVEHFDRLMDEQRAKGRAARVQDGMSGDGALGSLANDWRASVGDRVSVFTGYEEELTQAEVVAICLDGKMVDRVDGENRQFDFMLDRTPFYTESGGQTSDKGQIDSPDCAARVESSFKPDEDHIFHRARLLTGRLKVGDEIIARVDAPRRAGIRRAHSATHLLHAALRSKLGDHVRQAGSSVENDRLRFDYSHFEPLTDSERVSILEWVNDAIVANIAIETSIMGRDEALDSGARALFGEKYHDSVRVVSIGDRSKELCGGTHARATGDIGLFWFGSDSALASGTRRIEASTGALALRRILQIDSTLNEATRLLKAPPVEIVDKIDRELKSLKEERKENRRLKEALMLARSGAGAGPGEEKRIELDRIELLTRRLDEADIDSLRNFVDRAKNSARKEMVIVVGSVLDSKALLAVGVTKKSLDRLDAGKIVKELAKIVGGGGGGRPDFATAGGKDGSKLDSALDRAGALVEAILRKS